jgi:hypothetical protein
MRIPLFVTFAPQDQADLNSCPGTAARSSDTASIDERAMPRCDTTPVDLISRMIGATFLAKRSASALTLATARHEYQQAVGCRAQHREPW